MCYDVNSNLLQVTMYWVYLATSIDKGFLLNKDMKLSLFFNFLLHFWKCSFMFKQKKPLRSRPCCIKNDEILWDKELNRALTPTSMHIFWMNWNIDCKLGLLTLQNLSHVPTERIQCLEKILPNHGFNWFKPWSMREDLNQTAKKVYIHFRKDNPTFYSQKTTSTHSI